MDEIFGLLDVVFSLSCILLLFVVLGQLAKQASRLKGAIIFLEVVALLLIFSAFLPYSLIASVVGYTFGLIMRISSLRYRNVYLMTIVVAVGAALLDLLHDSEITRFGLPSLDLLTDPRVPSYIITESFIGSIFTISAVAACLSLVYILVRYLVSVQRNRGTPYLFS